MGEDIIARGPKGGLQKRRSRGEHSWHDPARQEVFLAELGATANISRSAQEAGLRPSGGYVFRQRDPVFRARWELALSQGVTRVRALLIEAAEAQAAMPRLPDGEIDRIALERYDPRTAMALLKMHGPTVDGEALGRGRPVPRSAEELRTMIRERLAEARETRNTAGRDAGE